LIKLRNFTALPFFYTQRCSDLFGSELFAYHDIPCIAFIDTKRSFIYYRHRYSVSLREIPTALLGKDGLDNHHALKLEA